MKLWLTLLPLTLGNVVFHQSKNTFPLYEGNDVEVYVDPKDWPGVIRAGDDLVKDFERVTGEQAYSLANLTLTNTLEAYCHSDASIVIGTIGKSSVIQSLIDNHDLDVTPIEGGWESYIIQYIEDCNTLVIAGSDKRGTIYGIYSISEQIGVSPWYYWSDVAVPHREEIYFNVSAPVIQGEPSVKYRGFFLNDEEPALSSWVTKNFPEGEYTHYTHEFYWTIFELLLRLKANTLWPAMWKSMFGLDDDTNQYWADYYGIVMSTSHTEPLQRATEEWTVKGNGSWDYTTNKDNILDFWREGIRRGKDYEGLWVDGMRGLGDNPISQDVEIDLIEEVIAEQRNLLQEGFGDDVNITDIPQVWCLYKEVQTYYEEGMEVPDDIILLWVDDNWGNIRRLPQGDEMNRTGGAGVYYHFDYVGDPRDYKWINTISLARTWEQHNLAYNKNATDFWVVNVGDMKALEIPITYYFDIAYDFPRWGQPNQILDWTTYWVDKQFGSFVNESVVDEIADIIDMYGFLASKVKYELLNTTTYSLINYNEAETVLSQWKDLSDRAWAVYNESSEEIQPSFFELVLHPCHAGYIVHDIIISAGKNELYIEQRRNQANYLADHVRAKFKEDKQWRDTWDELLDGKWEHMMDQPHLGYSYWQQPMRNAMPFIGEILLEDESLSGSAGLAIDGSNGSIPGDNQYNGGTYNNNTLILPQQDPYSGKTWIEVFNRGTLDFDFEILPWNDFVNVTPSTGKLSASNESIWNSLKLDVTVDWDKADEGWSLQYMNFTTNVSSNFYIVPSYIYLPINNTKVPEDTKDVFVESNGHISIEAHHFTGNQSQNDTYYVALNRFGLTDSGVTLFPVNADSQVADEDSSFLEYDFYSFTGSNVSNISVILSPSLNINPFKPLKYAIAIDDEEPKELQVYFDNTEPTAYPKGWEGAVARNSWVRTTMHDISSGHHTLKLWALEPNIVVQKIIVDFGGVKPSHFGPPESYFLE